MFISCIVLAVIVQIIFFSFNDLLSSTIENRFTNYWLDPYKNNGFNSQQYSYTSFDYTAFNISAFGQLRSIYNKNAQNDCKRLLETHDFTKYSCDEISQNPCFLSDKYCYTINPRDWNKIVIAQTTNFVNETYFVFFLAITALISFNFCRCCCGNTVFQIANRQWNIIIVICNICCFVPFVVSLILTMALLSPIISIHLNYSVLTDVKTFSETLSDIVTGETIDFTTIKPENIDYYNLRNCSENKWIETDDDLQKCTTNNGIKLCCIEDLSFTEEAYSLMPYQKIAMKYANYAPEKYIKVINMGIYLFEIISFYVQPIELIICICIYFRKWILCMLLCKCCTTRRQTNTVVIPITTTPEIEMV